MEKKNSKEIERKSSNEINNNKNKLMSFLNKRKISSSDSKEIKENQESISDYQNNANYLNSLLKKSFFNTINNTSLSTTSPSKQKKENNNSLLYPSQIPKNFLPIYLYGNINLDTNKKTTRQIKNEFRNVLDLYEKQKNEMKKYEEEIKETKDDLKKAKDAKNKIMEEVFQIKKEIENINELDMNNSFLNKNNRSRLSMQVGNINLNNLLKNLDMNDTTELDNDIREYEDKISKLKFDNKSFMEDYDMLMNDYKNNLNMNLKIKQYINNMDKKIKDSMQEKKDLKKYIDRMGKI